MGITVPRLLHERRQDERNKNNSPLLGIIRLFSRRGKLVIEYPCTVDRFQLVIVVSFEISDFFYYFSSFFFLGIEIHRVVGVHHTEEVEEWKKLEMNEEICERTTYECLIG